MRTKEILFALAGALLAQNLYAWGAAGHRVIGLAAIEMLDDRAAAEVSRLLGEPSPDHIDDAISQACIWPDTIRDEHEWKWSSPLHYVNIPRHSSEYERERDCPEGRCVTEGILHFASQLGYEDLEPERRRQAFAFVCHLVADLHQPLHAGFRDDLGANTVNIVYRDEKWNLHQFWDSVLPNERLGDEDKMVQRLADAGRRQAGTYWHARDVKAWTEESHMLAADRAYPGGRVVDPEFADQSWALAIEQWEKAAWRLAQVLNSVLGEGEVRPD